jgi:hypothetical protein
MSIQCTDIHSYLYVPVCGSREKKEATLTLSAEVNALCAPNDEWISECSVCQQHCMRVSNHMAIMYRIDLTEKVGHFKKRAYRYTSARLMLQNIKT